MAITAQQKRKIKLVEKEKKKKTAEELIKKSEKVWRDENLVRIVESPPLKKDGSMNLTEI